MLAIAKTLGDILKEKDENDCEYIECRVVFEKKGEIFDEFFGACRFVDGKLISLDGDSYYLNDEYFKHNWWLDDDGLWKLTVWEFAKCS